MPACLIYIRLRTGVSGTVGNQHIGFSLQKTSATEFMCTQYLPLGSDVVVNLAQKRFGPASNGLCIHGVSHHKYLVIYLDIDGAGNRVPLALQRQEASFPPLHLCNRYIIAILFGHRSNCFNQFQDYKYQKRHHCQQTTNFYEPQHPTEE